MNVLLIGGSGSLIDHMIIKLNKAGHRIYLLTGSRFRNTPYQKIFERYDFTYDAECIGDIFQAISPDVTIFMGAFDTNFVWKEEEKTSVRFSTSMTNLLMSYAMNSRGRFIFLSSDQVYGDNYPDDITEQEKVSPTTLKGLALVQAENLCKSYMENRELDICILRLDHLYSVPKKRREVNSLPAQMCLDALENNKITVSAKDRFSLLYETDAVEAIYQVVACESHEHWLYQISSDRVLTGGELAAMAKKAMGDTAEIEALPIPGRQCVLSGERMHKEFGIDNYCQVSGIVEMIAQNMRKNSYIFLTGQDEKPSLWQRFLEKSGWLFKAMVPFLENLVVFALVFVITGITLNSGYLSKLDLYLLYVLLFAIVYGQQQATFSAVLATIGYCFYAYSDNGFSLVLDANTYIWITQLFILGLAVGYLKDQIAVLKKEGEEARDYLTVQLEDLQEINNSNVRVKNALETQLVNQNDSVGKIYRITSALDYYSPEEVLFYAADVIRQLMGSQDVAIYAVSNMNYARIFSSTSKKARELGNSIRYTQMGELYEEVSKHKVYINRKMDENYPLMANAIFEEDRIQLLVFVWGISWEHMTLGQANQLTVASALIQEAVLRANRYLAVLENDRYIDETRMLKSEALDKLIRAYRKAQMQDLAECTILKINTGAELPEQVGQKLAKSLRQTDYIGMLGDGNLYVLLANTTASDAELVKERFRGSGYESDFVEELPL